MPSDPACAGRRRPAADLRTHPPAVPAVPGTPALACGGTAGSPQLSWDGPATPWGGVLTDERTQHRPQACRDEDCERYGCRMFREGFREGYGAGHAAGKAEGQAEGTPRATPTGYSEGYAAAAASGSG